MKTSLRVVCSLRAVERDCLNVIWLVTIHKTLIKLNLKTGIKQFPYQSPNISVSRDRENSRWNPGRFYLAPLLSSTDRTEAPALFHKSHPLCLQAFPTSILLNEDSYNAYRDTADRHFQLLTALFILAQHNPIRKVELNSVQLCSDQTHKFAHTWTAPVERIALRDTGWIHSAGLHPKKTPSVGAELHLHEWKAVGWLASPSVQAFWDPCLLPI